MITCTVTVHDNKDQLYNLFKAQNLESKRATCTIENSKELTFTITAKDPISLKAFVTSILNTIHVFEKTKTL